MNNSQETGIVTFAPEPNGRGTASLLISCVLTLVLCVWSALHFNVPARSTTTTRSAILSIRWIVTGVFGPELVAFTAWRQWCAARLLTSLINKPQHNSPDDRDERVETSQSRAASHNTQDHASLLSGLDDHDWTIAHSFYAIGGGFVFDIDKEDTQMQFLPEGCPSRLSLTAHGVALLIKCGHIPTLPVRDLWDKSKGNNMTKALVVIQALWMLCQICGRLSQGLPVTLLEINTAAHILCVILIYSMWWNKPLSVNEAIILHGDWISELLAFMYICSQISGNLGAKTRESETRVKTLFASLSLYSKSAEVEHLTYALPSCSHEPRCQLPKTERQDLGTITAPVSVISCCTHRFRLCTQKSMVNLTQLRKKDAAGMAFFERRPKIKDSDTDLTPPDDARTKLRWHLAARAIQHYPFLLDDVISGRDNSVYLKPTEYLVSCVPNWPQGDLMRTTDGLVVGMILWLASFIYGAIHATAWEAYFPTPAEMWLWRISSVYIAFCGGLWILLNWLTKMWAPLERFWNRWVDGQCRWWQYVLILPWVVVCGFSFFVARGYLVVEAFISLRSQPGTIYETPDWSQVFPHF